MADKQLTGDRVYTLQEVADIMKLNKQTIQNYVKNGTLKATKFGRVYRVTEEELKRFMNTGTEKKKK